MCSEDEAEKKNCIMDHTIFSFFFASANVDRKRSPWCPISRKKMLHKKILFLLSVSWITSAFCNILREACARQQQRISYIAIRSGFFSFSYAFPSSLRPFLSCEYTHERIILPATPHTLDWRFPTPSGYFLMRVERWRKKVRKANGHFKERNLSRHHGMKSRFIARSILISLFRKIYIQSYKAMYKADQS